MQVLQHARYTKERLFKEVESFEKERDALLALHMDRLESKFEAKLQETPLGEVRLTKYAFTGGATSGCPLGARP
jgi:hypothetical protein